MSKTKEPSAAVLKKREDRASIARFIFEPVITEIKSANTMMLLLQSEEDYIVIQALASLDMYAMKAEDNVKVINDNKGLEVLLPLVDHTEQCIHRFATKLISELSALESAKQLLLSYGDKVTKFMEILKHTSDTVMKEFSSAIVADLTEDMNGCEQCVNSGLIEILVPHLSSTDPDVQKNCLQIIYNILQDPTCGEIFVKCEEFQFKPFLDLLTSEYPVLQKLALDTMLCLVDQSCKNYCLQEKFLQDNGQERLLDLLQELEWKDIHDKCLQMLAILCDSPLMADRLQGIGVYRLILYMDQIHQADLRTQVVAVLMKLSVTSNGKKFLIENDIVEKTVSIMMGDTAGLTASICLGLANIAKDGLGLMRIGETDVLHNLVSILKSNERDWETKHAAVTALYEILQRDVRLCIQLTEGNRQEMLIDLLCQHQEKMSVNMAATVVNCLTILGQASEVRPHMLMLKLINALLTCFEEREGDTTILKVAGCNALAVYVCEPIIRQWLHEKSGLKTICTNLMSYRQNIPVLEAAAQMFNLSITCNGFLASDLIEMGMLKWLISQKTLRTECPSWETALQAILDNYLPYKFAYCQHIGLADVTSNGFYITRHAPTAKQLEDYKYPHIEHLMKIGACPIQLVYVANFERSSSSYSLVSRTSKQSEESGTSTMASKKSLSKRVSYESSRKSMKSIYGTVYPYSLIPDNYLCDYVEELRSNLNKLEQAKFIVGKKMSMGADPCANDREISDVLDGETVRIITKIIAEFVSKQLSGPVPLEPCTRHSLELHITELKIELESSVLPIGFLRIGRYTERAFLFKVLADCLGFPCSLVRGTRGRSWIEVAIPTLPPAPRPALPTTLQQPNYLVDLMFSPGALLNLHSYEADTYKGKII